MRGEKAERFVVANKKNRWYTTDPSLLMRNAEIALKDIVLFADEVGAQAQGFHSRRHAAEPKPPRQAAA